MSLDCTRLPRRRCGLTLAEVIVALTLVAVGLLGIAGSSALSMRRVVADAEERRAIDRVRLRIALLEAGGCRTAASGRADDIAAGRAEHWHIGTSSPVMLQLDDSLSWRADGRDHALVIRSALLC